MGVQLTASEDGPCEITLFQPDVRPSFDPQKGRRQYASCVLSLVQGDGDDEEAVEVVRCSFRQVCRCLIIPSMTNEAGGLKDYLEPGQMHSIIQIA